MVEVTGFEPAAPTSLTWCANRAALHLVRQQSYEISTKIKAPKRYSFVYCKLIMKLESPSSTDSKFLTAEQTGLAFIKQSRALIEEGMKGLCFPDTPSGLYEPVRYALQHQGKRIRPLFTLLSYGLFRDKVEEVLRPALALELFHNFTLIHDDVMDAAPLRRGVSSLYAKWGTSVAILAGDTTLIEGYRLLSELPNALISEVLEKFNQSAIHVCEGQQMDLDFERQNEVTEEDYLEMIRLKTGCLLGFGFALGAMAAEVPNVVVQQLEQLGQRIGLIFQLRDDYLDVYGDEETFGKRAGGDIISNKKTFLLVKTLQKAGPSEMKTLRRWIEAKDFNEEEKIQAVTALYDQLLIPQEVTAKINELHTNCHVLIDQIKAPKPRKEAIRWCLQQLTVRAK